MNPDEFPLDKEWMRRRVRKVARGDRVESLGLSATQNALDSFGNVDDLLGIPVTKQNSEVGKRMPHPPTATCHPGIFEQKQPKVDGPSWQWSRALTKREELSFRTVLALPKASRAGLAWMIWSSRVPCERSRALRVNFCPPPDSGWGGQRAAMVLGSGGGAGGLLAGLWFQRTIFRPRVHVSCQVGLE